jgi:Tfp pilus assembly protein PilF
LDDIDRSIELYPADTASLQHRGNILMALNRVEEARQAYERTLKLNPEDGGAWNNYGVALEGLGRTNEAFQAFRRGTQCHPPSENAFLGLALEQIGSGRLGEAADTLDQLDKLERSPNAVVVAIRSVLARRHGDVAQADAMERLARSMDPAAAAWAIQRATSQPNLDTNPNRF